MSTGRYLFILSGPSGSGKATMLEYATAHAPVHRVVTYTTRNPRPNEKDGIDYHFVSADEFDRLFQDGKIIEREQVYGDFFYGSPRDVFGSDPRHAIMELDTAGAATYRSVYPDAITVFILPPSITELVQRIVLRHAEANFAGRLRTALPMMEKADKYDHFIINDDRDVAGQKLLKIIAEPSRCPDYAREKALLKELISEIRAKLELQ